MEILLSDRDSNQLKFIRNLASSIENTFLYLNDTIHDMVGNVITPFYRGLYQPRPANDYTTDNTDPCLVTFDFDLDEGLLHLTFSEVVDDIYEPSFSLQNDRFLMNTTESYTLTGSHSLYGPSLLPNGPGHPPELTLAFSDFDLNEVKKLDHLAVSNDTTYIAVTTMGAMDAFENSLKPINDTYALRVLKWTEDTTMPLLVNFDFSVNSGLLVLTFDETVRISTFNATTVTFVNNDTKTMYSLQHHPPSKGAEIKNNDSIIVELTLANDDLNELKSLTDIATMESTTYIQLEPTTVEDMRGNLLNISNLPLEVGIYENDTTHPELRSFDLDMNEGVLTLYFSESVNVSSLSIGEITLQASENETLSSFSYTLQYAGPHPEGSFTNSTDGPIIIVNLGDNDLNEVKRIPELATLDNNTFITLSALVVRDMAGLNLIPIRNGNATQVRESGYIADITRPNLLDFDFDLDVGLLVLTFDETHPLFISLCKDALVYNKKIILGQTSEGEFKILHAMKV